MISYFLFGQSEAIRDQVLFEIGIHTSPNLFPVPSKQQPIVRGLGGAGSWAKDSIDKGDTIEVIPI